MNRSLWPHQTEGIAMLRHSLGSGHRRPMLASPTGSGKTLLTAAIVDGALRKGKRVCFIVPAVSLINQTVKAFYDEGISDVGVIQASHPMTNPSRPVQVASVQTLHRRERPKADLFVIDEAHILHKTHKDLLSDEALKSVPMIGLSATPWRKGLGKFYDDLLIVTTTQRLIDDGFLSRFKVFAPSHPDLSGVRIVAGDYHEGDLGDTMNTSPLVADVVSNWLTNGEGRPTLCFAVDRAHAKHLQEQFLAAGVPAGYIDCNVSGEDREPILKQFRRGDIKVICNVGTMTTGIDLDVRCLILARPTKSESLFCLDAETEVLTSHGWKGIGEVRVGDCVAAMSDLTTGDGRWSRVLATVERDMDASESWVEYNAPRANFRVTDRHRLIFRGGNDSRGFRIAEAREAVGYSDGIRMPTAVSIRQVGVPLTDDELYFVGMMMADGTWTSTAGSISQSERHPEIVERIERVLKACGIGYAKRRVVPDGTMAERFPRWVFSFSAGKPKPHKRLGATICGNAPKTDYIFVSGTTGYRHLLPYLDKDFAPALFQMSKGQLLKLLSGLWDGDGSKKLGVDYTPRSLEICSARKVMVDRLQALCAINGLTANLRLENGPSRKTPIYLITVTDKDWRSCGGYVAAGRAARPCLELRPATQERVWCVETEVGTLVTRRRGKVTVMGNCQIIGRSLRTALGKDHAIIFDHSDTHARLGFVTDIHHDKLDDGSGPGEAKPRPKPMPKECPSCYFLRPAKVSLCPACGFKPTRQCDVEVEDGELVEFGAASRENRHAAKAEQQRWFSMLLGVAETRGYKPGWAAANYKDRFKAWPDGLDKRPCEPSPEVVSWVRHKMIQFAKRRAA